MTEKKTGRKTEKDTRKAVSDDVEKFFRDVWGKVVEYASLGAEEASKLSNTAKKRVDIETLRFKRGKVIKMLGERYLDLCEKDSSLAVPGTREILRDIKGIDKEIETLEKQMAQSGKPAGKKPAGAAPKKAAPKKAPVKKKPPAKKPARQRTAPKKTSEPEAPDQIPEPPGTEE
jgi:hypothetical protein